MEGQEGSLTEHLIAGEGWSPVLLRTAGGWGGTCLSGVLSKGRKLACSKVPESSVLMKSYIEATPKRKKKKNRAGMR